MATQTTTQATSTSTTRPPAPTNVPGHYPVTSSPDPTFVTPQQGDKDQNLDNLSEFGFEETRGSFHESEIDLEEEDPTTDPSYTRLMNQYQNNNPSISWDSPSIRHVKAMEQNPAYRIKHSLREQERQKSVKQQLTAQRQAYIEQV
jgi:hypothetical protein